MNEPPPPKHAVRSVIMIHQGPVAGVGMYLINTSFPLAQSGLDACISSRITTVIHVVGTIK